jgi:hypothetical protein
VRCLLVPQARGDKSAFLQRAGYTLEKADQLLRDLRMQLLPLEATPLQSNKFGRYYEIRGKLAGPNGGRLAVRTIWITERLSGVTRFVTLTYLPMDGNGLLKLADLENAITDETAVVSLIASLPRRLEFHHLWPTKTAPPCGPKRDIDSPL